MPKRSGAAATNKLDVIAPQVRLQIGRKVRPHGVARTSWLVAVSTAALAIPIGSEAGRRLRRNIAAKMNCVAALSTARRTGRTGHLLGHPSKRHGAARLREPGAKKKDHA
mmetsp:Transcript_22776/g.43684  ORF Transcript_22776/g.43684 Transcript_22776/m.43684 type:complete len:110 (-) Transcript_22776:83-412(-)